LQFELKEKLFLDSNQYNNPTKNDSIFKVFILNKLKYVKENQTIIGYSILVELLQNVDFFTFLDKSELKQIATSFQEKFPNHPYSEIVQVFKSFKVGGYYANFIAPDMDGKLIELSDVIKANKMTLIDLWAPWCSPCILKGREMIPLYKRYKDAGFGIIGVIGGIKDLESYKKAIEKECYSWANLIEIKNENKIWEKYNIMNAGGRMFLIDKKGIILAIDPTVDETEKILKEKL
jgi:thiol-disulfide isomerase/thioredoxin